MLSNKQIAAIHILKNKLSMQDAEYRELLLNVCQVHSSKDISNYSDYHKLLAELKRRLRPGMATEQQIKHIISAWKLVTLYPENWENALNNFLHKRFNISHYRFLTAKKASGVIEAIKQMYNRKYPEETNKKGLTICKQ